VRRAAREGWPCARLPPVEDRGRWLVDELAAMRRAITLGIEGLGTTSPNPSVGCVLLSPSGELLGEGRTEPPPGRHAEVVALAEAGPRAAGATAVVTLEPCNHVGTTGPCAAALIAAGVERVVFAEADPHPRAGGGSATLRAAGVTVEHRPPADYLHPWLTSTASARPFVTWKTATTLDGRTAAPDGTSRWITSPAAREEVHALRAVVDAVIVGSGTVLADDPVLTDRRPGAQRQPARIVLDRRGRTPGTAKVHPALILRGTPQEALAELFASGHRHVLLEGGATVAGAFLEAGLVDEIRWYVAPLVLGAGIPAVVTQAATLADATSWQIQDLARVGEDVRIDVRRSR
jgi:diaminohydroxyphosphoribosylaminopyrimidine deaminase/5-amino-6-(5-phosphoribosylamino)uracil reductase